MPDSVTIEDRLPPPHEKHTTRSFYRWRFRAVAGVALVALVGYGALRWWEQRRYIVTTDDAYVGGDVTPIAPHVSGFVSGILVHDNERVHVGQLLCRLDVRDFSVAVERAQAELQEKLAELVTLDAEDRAQRQKVLESQSELEERIARSEFALSDAQRYATLAKTSAATQQDAQRSATALKESRLSVQAERAAVLEVQAQGDIISARRRVAEAALAAVKATLAAAQLSLSYTEVRSPIEGYVGNRTAHEGMYVAAGTYLMSIVPARGLWVDANFKEDQTSRIREGDLVTLYADAESDKPFHGRVVSVAPGTGAVFSVIPPENATGNFTKIVQRVPVRVSVDDAEAGSGRLRAGFSVTARIDTRPHS